LITNAVGDDVPNGDSELLLCEGGLLILHLSSFAVNRCCLPLDHDGALSSGQSESPARIYRSIGDA
jgi:hypothetical protein